MQVDLFICSFDTCLFMHACLQLPWPSSCIIIGHPSCLSFWRANNDDNDDMIIKPMPSCCIKSIGPNLPLSLVHICLSHDDWLIPVFSTHVVFVLLAARLFVQNCGFGVCWCCDCDSRKQENHLSPLWSTFWLCGSQHQHCYTILPWPMAHKIIHDLYKSLQCTCKTMLGVLFGYCSCCCHWLCQHFCSKNTQQCSNNLAWSINIVGHMICLLLLIEKLVLSSVTWLLWRDQEGTEWFPRTGSQ